MGHALSQFTSSTKRPQQETNGRKTIDRSESSRSHKCFTAAGTLNADWSGLANHEAHKLRLCLWNFHGFTMPV